MSTSELHTFLHPYFDGELNLTESLAFEEHLASCPDCARSLVEQKKLRAVLEQSSLRYQTPKEFKRRLESSFPVEVASSKVSVYYNWRLYGIAASIALIVLSVWTFIPKNSATSQPSVSAEIVSSHIRSLMASHLFDVASTDQHTVKPWFAGKLDFSPVVKDFPEKNFHLIGGRLDYIQGRTVAVIVYQHDKHIINVFQWASRRRESAEHVMEQDKGFNLIAGYLGELSFWMISDLNTKELVLLGDALKTP